MILGAVTYVLWGLFPLYFALLDSVSPIEVVAHRVVWCLVFLCIILSISRGWRALLVVSHSRRTVGLLAVAAAFLSINWGVYVYAVHINKVVEASLGYFINPLVSVALGVVILRERLRPLQWTGIGLAVSAVLVLSFAAGHPPWISLILASSFGIYGLIKKVVGIGSVQSLAIETAALAPIALTLMIVAFADGSGALIHDGPGMTLLLILLGPVTAIPLITFGAAATRIPLSTLGVLQYLTPILQFIMGVTIFGEVMSSGQWVGFFIVWIALMVFTFDTLRQARRASGQRADVLDPGSLQVIEPD